MIRLLMCIFGLHGSREIDYTNDQKEICVCRDHQIDKRSRKGSSNHIAEAIIRLPGIEFFAHATADDMYTSIKLLTEKLKRQIDRYREMHLQQHALAL